MWGDGLTGPGCVDIVLCKNLLDMPLLSKSGSLDCFSSVFDLSREQEENMVMGKGNCASEKNRISMSCPNDKASKL